MTAQNHTEPRDNFGPPGQGTGMLILTRNAGQRLYIVNGDAVVEVTIKHIGANRVRFLVDAPKEVEIEKLRKVEAVKLPT